MFGERDASFVEEVTASDRNQDNEARQTDDRG